MMIENACHLHGSHALNQMVTTITASARLCTVWDEESPIESMVLDAATHLLDLEEYHPSKSCSSGTHFKNCVIVRLGRKSNRSTDMGNKKKGMRWIAVKIFRNMSLHITGTYCVEMLIEAINKVATDLGRLLGTDLVMDGCSLTMVNYSYSLPGRVNLSQLTKDLSENGELVIFDPSKYAGVNVKYNMNGIECSILIFEPGKIIISTPQYINRDELLYKIIEFIERRIVQNWNQYCLTACKKRKRSIA